MYSSYVGIIGSVAHKIFRKNNIFNRRNPSSSYVGVIDRIITNL